ncbi:hypothetical protein OpiT1DRAFT_03257 [Opitutaceae bacterium TAV1]|nr:hypothetical protein OpiT1DRAFT_03257 [Opitutaceae bacterium TAV1]
MILSGSRVARAFGLRAGAGDDPAASVSPWTGTRGGGREERRGTLTVVCKGIEKVPVRLPALLAPAASPRTVSAPGSICFLTTSDPVRASHF